MSNDGVIDEDRYCTHIRSEWSRALDRDTFIFWSSAPSNLLIGLNQRLTHATISGLHRWMRIVAPSMPDAELRPAAVRKFDVLRYTVVPRADALTALDTSPLSSGVGDYERDLFGYAEPVALGPEASFEQCLQLSKKHPDSVTRLDLYTFPPSVEQSVRLRDNVCFITGATPDAELDLSWICPPTWAYLLDPWRSPVTCDYEPFLTASNACMMRSDLLSLFHANAFGIDVDDDFRVVVFRDTGSVTLPSHVPKSQNSASAGPGDRFLREHFRWCLLVNILGGDITEDYDSNRVVRVMEGLGMCRGDIPLAPVDDERWDSLIGKELWEVLILDAFRDAINAIEDDSGWDSTITPS
ncbi:hypothetical protein JB92DRAFT_3134603 [Gautieria morchelliformis]|nr:hypothetical protein JB92DRAFT_3134603 [Gautieria morchelliformis]